MNASIIFSFHGPIEDKIKKWHNYGYNYTKPYMMHKEMINIGFVARVLYIQIMLASIILSVFNFNFLLIPILQLGSLFLIYVYISIKIRKIQ